VADPRQSRTAHRCFADNSESNSVVMRDSFAELFRVYRDIRAPDVARFADNLSSFPAAIIPRCQELFAVNFAREAQYGNLEPR
jgi:hypothetical protein